MLTEAEARLWGGLLTAIGTAVMACGLVRVLIPAADWSLYVASLAIGFGAPMFAAGWKWLGAESSKAKVQLEGDRLRNRVIAAELAERNQPAIDDAERPVAPADPKREAKALAIETFFRAGDKAGGFSEGKLAGCVGSDHGPWLRHFYISPAGGEWLRDAGSSVGTTWNYERTLDGVLQALRADTLPLPPGPVPDVHPLPDSAAQRRAPQKGKAAARQTIDGVARPAER